LLDIQFSEDLCTPETFADGSFLWTEQDKALTLSNSLKYLVERDTALFKMGFNSDFFKSAKKIREEFYVKEFSFYNKSSDREISLSFRFKSCNDTSVLSGSVYVLQKPIDFDPIASVYKKISLRAISSGFAHDISNPLAIISSVTDWMGLRIAKSDVDAVSFQTKLDVIKNSILRMQKLITGIEKSVRGFVFDGDDFFVEMAVERTLKIFFSRIKNHQITYSLNLLEKVKVNGDPVLVSQVLFNIISTVVATAGEQSTKRHFDISSEKIGPFLEITFTVAGVFKDGSDSFYQGVNVDVINMMLSPYSGEFYLQTSPEMMMFALKLKLST